MTILSSGAADLVRLRFADDDLRRLFEEPGFRLARVGDRVTTSYRRKVGFLAAARDSRDVRALRSLHLEKLKGTRRDQYSIRLDHQWRLILRFETDGDGALIAVIEIVDYH